MNKGYLTKLQNLHNSVTEAYSHIIRLWAANCFSIWQWWLSIALLIIPWVLWIRYRKKESTGRLLSASFLIICIATHLDTIGVLLGVWSYNNDIILLFPCLIVFDLSLLPVATMVFLEYKPNFNPFIKAVIYSAICSFVTQPLFSWLGFYNPKHWKHYYSFPIFILLYLLVHFYVNRENFSKL
jgi:hypothetical protein